MKIPKVSVIVPVYNLENYVTECIESLVGQKTDFEFEVVAIDDGSGDNSYKLLEELESRFPEQLKIARNKKNSGLAKTMKNLLARAKGEYIAYLDGDDLALPGKLQIQADYLDNNPDCTIVYHESDVFDSETNQSLWVYTRDYYNRQYISQKASVEDVIRYGCFMQASTVMVRRHKYLLDTVDETNQILLDHPWHVLNLIYGKGSIDFINKILGRYRIHKDSFGGMTRESALPQRREQVLNDQLYVCDLAYFHGVAKDIIEQGKKHYYYATALYFLRDKNDILFRKYLELSVQDEWFFNNKHKLIWNNRTNAELLRIRFFSELYPKTDSCCE